MAQSGIMDSIDRAILRQLQRDSSIPNQELAARVGLSPSPCLRRVRALEASGAISGYVAILDGAAIGTGFEAFVEVRLEKQSEAVAQGFEQTIRGRDEVLECAFITGDYDYLLKVAVADMAAFHQFMSQVLGRQPGVANTRTILPVKRIKATTARRIA